MSDARFTDLVIKDFRLGVDMFHSDGALQPNELSDASNVIPSTPGAIATRAGSTLFKATALAAAQVKSLLWFARDAIAASDIAVAICNNKVYGVDIAGTATDLGLGTSSNFTLPTACTHYPTVQVMDRVYGLAWKYTSASRAFVVAENVGTATTLKAWRAGVHPPVAALTYTDATGLLSGVFKYKAAYFYGEDGGHGESNPCATALTTSSLTLKKVILTIFGTGKDYADWDAAHDAGIDKVRIYRTEAGGADYYFHADVTSGLTYEDNTVADDTTTVPQTDNYPTPEGKCIALVGGRLFVGCTFETVLLPRRVRWSLPGFPDIFPAQNYCDADGDLGEVWGVAGMDGATYIFQEYGISRLIVTGAADYTLTRVARTNLNWRTDAKTIVLVDEGGQHSLMFDAGGIFRFDGTYVQKISDEVDSVMGSSAGAAVYDGRYYRYFRPTASADPNELRYDTITRRTNERGYQTGTWWPQRNEMGTSYVTAACVFGDFSDVLVGDEHGYLYWLEQGGTQDYEADQPSYRIGDFSLGYWDGGSPTTKKRLAKILVEATCAGTVTVEWTTDYGADTGTFTLTPSASLGLSIKHIIDIVDFKRVKIRVYGTGSHTFTIYSITLRVGEVAPA